MSWFGKRNDHTVQCRLDRAMSNVDWNDIFPLARVIYLQRVASDHSPILVNIDGTQTLYRQKFKYDERWIQKDGFKEAVQGWNSGSGTSNTTTLVDRISQCRLSMFKWKKENPNNSKIRIDYLKKRIDYVSHQPQHDTKTLQDLRDELSSEYKMEELYWKQNSRVLWLQEGDRNTKFLHAATKQRRLKNRILSLTDEEGIECFKVEKLAEIAEMYFKKTYASDNIEENLDAYDPFEKRITDDENTLLTKPATMEEIRSAVFDIHPGKSPGPDGLTGRFYQHFWNDIGSHVKLMVDQFFEEGKIDKGLNKTNICLIPKLNHPKSLKEYRPISLCNVGYKIIAKILTKRIKPILQRFVSETQSAFVSGRLISDNILLAHELIHTLNTKKNISEDFMAIKTDMTKAYDRIE